MSTFNEAPETLDSDFPQLPKFFVISRDLEPEQLERYRTALSLLSLQYLITADPRDFKVVQPLGFTFEYSLQADSPERALALAEELYEIDGARSLVVIRQNESFTAKYPRKEDVHAYTDGY